MEILIAQDIFRNTFLRVFETLVSFFDSSQASGLTHAQLDPQIMAGLFFGSLVHTARCDRIGEKFFQTTLKSPEYREKVVDHLIHWCASGCLATMETKHE